MLHTQMDRFIHAVTSLHGVQSECTVTGLTWNRRVTSAGGGDGGEQLLNV